MLTRILKIIIFTVIAIGPLSGLQQPLPSLKKQVLINLDALGSYSPKDTDITLQYSPKNQNGNPVYSIKATNTPRGHGYLLVVQRLDGALMIKAPVKIKNEKLVRTDRDEPVAIPIDRVFPGERVDCFLVTEDGQKPLAKIGFTPHPIIAWMSDGPSISANLVDVDAHHYLIRGKNFQPYEEIHFVTTWGEQVEARDLIADASGSFGTIFSPVEEGRRGGITCLAVQCSQGDINLRLPWGVAYYTWAVHTKKTAEAQHSGSR